MSELQLDVLKSKYPLLTPMMACEELFWLNPLATGLAADSTAAPEAMFTAEDVEAVEARLQHFRPYLKKVFPQTEAADGLVESPLKEIPEMHKILAGEADKKVEGRLLLKCDSMLPISGSIKARGGFHEILKLAETIALREGMLQLTDDYSILAEPRFRELFSKYSVAVGSTGNLGLSIGIMSAQLGFHVTIHMSADARQWKKDMLREKGAIVVEYPDDYQKAVAEGRKAAANDPMCHFVDDEGSADLFLGYATAARRLDFQLRELDVTVDEEHPLFVYLPCGVGGGPGGVAFGLKLLYGDNVHCFFAEPTHAPCMALGMMTGLHNEIACSDIGLDGKTAADGLAVGRASRLVGKIMEDKLDGVFTVEDDKLYHLLTKLADSEGIYIEPSACAGFPGVMALQDQKDYLDRMGLTGNMSQATHIVWATGGSMVPEAEMQSYYNKGKTL
ncbi:MAG: D-serine ammonia-lyase [Firmicutes bacterium]|nr:D-serine ammonia-lyase [Bacillota bacterium]